MRIEFNRTGAERKALVKAISEITGAEAIYKFMPTCAYEIDYFTVTKDGALEFDDRADSEEIENLLEQLAQRGFEGTAPEATDIAPEMPDTAAESEIEEVSAESKTSEHKPTQWEQCESIDLTITLPLESVAVGNLTKLLNAKGSLIKKALGVDDLRFEINEESKTICFPWFGEVSFDEAMAYTHFVNSLCKMTKEAKRVTAKEKIVDNEKYAFRCFLLRLGFIGTEYKTERKILLRNLSGSSAFKAGRDGEQE